MRLGAKAGRRKKPAYTLEMPFYGDVLNDLYTQGPRRVHTYLSDFGRAKQGSVG